MKISRTLSIDCRKETTPALVHKSIARQLRFPLHYGANLDALRDSLTDVLLEYNVRLSWKDTGPSSQSKALSDIYTLIEKTIARKK